MQTLRNYNSVPHAVQWCRDFRVGRLSVNSRRFSRYGWRLMGYSRMHSYRVYSYHDMYPIAISMYTSSDPRSGSRRPVAVYVKRPGDESRTTSRQIHIVDRALRYQFGGVPFLYLTPTVLFQVHRRLNHLETDRRQLTPEQVTAFCADVGVENEKQRVEEHIVEKYDEIMRTAVRLTQRVSNDCVQKIINDTAPGNHSWFECESA